MKGCLKTLVVCWVEPTQGIMVDRPTEVIETGGYIFTTRTREEVLRRRTSLQQRVMLRNLPFGLKSYLYTLLRLVPDLFYDQNHFLLQVQREEELLFELCGGVDK